jgi:hypothetical protein
VRHAARGTLRSVPTDRSRASIPTLPTTIPITGSRLRPVTGFDRQCPSGPLAPAAPSLAGADELRGGGWMPDGATPPPTPPRSSSPWWWWRCCWSTSCSDRWGADRVSLRVSPTLRGAATTSTRAWVRRRERPVELSRTACQGCGGSAQTRPSAHPARRCAWRREWATMAVRWHTRSTRGRRRAAARADDAALIDLRERLAPYGAPEPVPNRSDEQAARDGRRSRRPEPAELPPRHLAQPRHLAR